MHRVMHIHCTCLYAICNAGASTVTAAWRHRSKLGGCFATRPYLPSCKPGFQAGGHVDMHMYENELYVGKFVRVYRG